MIFYSIIIIVNIFTNLSLNTAEMYVLEVLEWLTKAIIGEAKERAKLE